MNLKGLYRMLVFMVGVCCGVLVFSLMRALFVVQKDLNPVLSYRFNGKTGLDLDDVNMLRQDHSENEVYHQGEGVIAEKLSSAVPVLCLVLVKKDTKYKKKSEAVKNTWGKRCNTLLFLSDFEDNDIPLLNLYVGTEKYSPWAVIKAAMRYIFIHYMNTHDWVLIAEEDTFVVVENLRYLLYNYTSSDALYLGCRFKKHVKQGFMSGGAGYVLSKEAVIRMVKDGLAKEVCNRENNGAPDVQIGLCMEKLNVTAVDTRDELGRGRFFPFPPKNHLIPGIIANNSWYWDMVYYPHNTGLNCCSDSAISFHEITPSEMYVMNYLIYHLRPYGVNPHHPLILLPDNDKSKQL